MLVAVGLVLAGCEEEVPTQVWDMKKCLAEQSELFCKESFETAKRLADQYGPVYATEEDCKAAHGSSGPDGAPACEQKGEFWTAEDGTVLNKDEAQKAQEQGQTVVHHNSGFSPWLYYWMGQQSASNNRAYSNYAPVYTSSGGGYSTLSGKTFPSTGAFKAYPSDAKVSTAAKPSRTFVETTTARGGFAKVAAGRGPGGLGG